MASTATNTTKTTTTIRTRRRIDVGESEHNYTFKLCELVCVVAHTMSGTSKRRSAVSVTLMLTTAKMCVCVVGYVDKFDALADDNNDDFIFSTLGANTSNIHRDRESSKPLGPMRR